MSAAGSDDFVTTTVVAPTDTALGDLETVLKALASTRRLQILTWLRDPVAHFPPQQHGDPAAHGACNLFIVDKLGVSQPAASRHLKLLVDAGLVIATRRRGWTYYRRDEPAIAAVAERLAALWTPRPYSNHSHSSNPPQEAPSCPTHPLHSSSEAAQASAPTPPASSPTTATSLV